MSWISITIAGILTYLTRMTMVALVKREMLGDKLKDVLAYVPSAVFPAIIFWSETNLLFIFFLIDMIPPDNPLPT